MSILIGSIYAECYELNQEECLYWADFCEWNDETGQCQEIGGGNDGGDSNADGIVNVLDVVVMVNLVLSGGYDEVTDMNGDGILNVLDVVLLVGIILNLFINQNSKTKPSVKTGGFFVTHRTLFYTLI